MVYAQVVNSNRPLVRIQTWLHWPHGLSDLGEYLRHVIVLVDQDVLGVLKTERYIWDTTVAGDNKWGQ